MKYFALVETWMGYFPECKIRNHPSHNSCARNGLPGKQIASGWVTLMEWARGAFQGVFTFWCFWSCDINLIFFAPNQVGCYTLLWSKLLKFPALAQADRRSCFSLRLFGLFHVTEKESGYSDHGFPGREQQMGSYLKQVRGRVVTLWIFYRSPRVCSDAHKAKRAGAQHPPGPSGAAGPGHSQKMSHPCSSRSQLLQQHPRKALSWSLKTEGKGQTQRAKKLQASWRVQTGF